MSLVLLKSGNKSTQYVQVEIFYTDEWICLTVRYLTTTITLKPANIPALGYNNFYRNIVSSGAFDVSLQCFNSSWPWKYYAKAPMERFSKGGRYSPALLFFFSIACFLVDPFSEWRMGFYYFHDKTDTLCNGNNYGTEKHREQEKGIWNIMLYKGVANNDFIF